MSIFDTTCRLKSCFLWSVADTTVEMSLIYLYLFCSPMSKWKPQDHKSALSTSDTPNCDVFPLDRCTDTLHIALGQQFCHLDSTCLEYVQLTNEQFKVPIGTDTDKQTSDKQKTQNVLRLSTVVQSAARFLSIHHFKSGYSPSTVIDLSKKGIWPISPYRRGNIETNKG